MRAHGSAPAPSKSGGASSKITGPVGVPSKILEVSLESAGAGAAVVLRCHDHVLSRNDGRSLAGLISEVLPSAKRMIVDLTEVRLVDGGTLGELAMVHLWADAAGLSLLLVGPSDRVLRLIEDASLDSLFDIYADVDSALAAMNLAGTYPEEMQSA